MDLKKKRKMNATLRGLIGKGFEGNQNAITKYLVEKGFNVTQSTVSRSLSKMGVVKESRGGKTYYRLPQHNANPQYGGALANLIISVENNESIIVVKTTPGSAMFVAGFIDHYGREFTLGSVAGDDTIFVAPRSTVKTAAYRKRIESYLFAQ